MRYSFHLAKSVKQIRNFIDLRTYKIEIMFEDKGKLANHKNPYVL